MDDNFILEGDTLISKFMDIDDGAPISKILAGSHRVYISHNKCHHRTGGLHGELYPTQYSYSYNWIMSVVNKIEAMGYDFVSSNHYVCVHPPYGTGRLVFRYQYTSETRNTRHELLYKAVVEFVKWHVNSYPDSYKL